MSTIYLPGQGVASEIIWILIRPVCDYAIDPVGEIDVCRCRSIFLLEARLYLSPGVRVGFIGKEVIDLVQIELVYCI